MQPDPQGQVPAMPRITDEDLESSRPAVRALLVARYESLWRPVQEALALAADPATAPVDPRLMELGVRVLKELGVLYGVARPRVVPQEEEPDEGLDPAVDRRSLVEDRLLEIEKRIKKQTGDN